jgi:membrane protein implicated in regulation of membrane protease activity
MAKSQGALILITMLIGALFFLSGLVFTLQGEGIVGPTNGFMYNSSTWIYNGIVILIVGIVLLAFSLYFRSRSKATSKTPLEMQGRAENQNSKSGP